MTDGEYRVDWMLSAPVKSGAEYSLSKISTACCSNAYRAAGLSFFRPSAMLVNAEEVSTNRPDASANFVSTKIRFLILDVPLESFAHRSRHFSPIACTSLTQMSDDFVAGSRWPYHQPRVGMSAARVAEGAETGEEPKGWAG